jgi:hypothetical protein
MKVLQHMQSQATKKMEHLASESQREAIAMRIIAAVTVFYLPATFVSVSQTVDTRKCKTLISADLFQY